MPGKREEVRGVTPLDIKKINDNFKNLWQSVFGNINFTDVNQEFSSKISALGNKILALSNSLKTHTESTSIHVNTTEKEKWNSKAEGRHIHSYNDIEEVVSSVLLSNEITPLNDVVECFKVGSLVYISGSVKNEKALSSGINTIGIIDEGFRPVNDIKLNIRTLKGLAKININVDGTIELDLSTSTGYIDSLEVLSSIYLDGICFKGE